MSPPIRFLLMITSCILLILAACTAQPLTITREPATLRIVAADSCKPLVEALATAYEDSHPWVTIETEVFNNSVAEEMLRRGGADLALFSHLQETNGENEEALWSQGFARDGIAVVVHPDSPLDETGLAQLQEIFLGRLQEWDGVVLTVVSREAGSGTRAVFEDIVLGEEDPTLTAVVMPSSEAVIEYVASTPGALGYVPTHRLDSRVRALPVESVPPTQEAIEDGSYPLSRSLHLATTSEPLDEVREFAQWVLGPEGRKTITDMNQ